MSDKLRVAFMGTPDFAATSLRALIDHDGIDVVCVYSQPPRPKGRGHKVQKSPVHEMAEASGIPVFTPKSLKSEEEQAVFAAHNLDVAVVAAYGLLLPPAVLEAPTFGCLNIHGSLLPRWRGASPIQRAIWAGDAKSGITIMQMDEGLDTGAMIVKDSIALDGNTTASSLHDDLAGMGARLIVDVLEGISASGQQPEAEAQDDALATYAHLLKKSDGVVDWAQSADEIDRQIRALNPWPGVWAEIQGKRFKILSAKPATAGASHLSKDGIMPCGGGSALHIFKLQPEGKQAMDFASAVNGGYIAIG